MSGIEFVDDQEPRAPRHRPAVEHSDAAPPRDRRFGVDTIRSWGPVVLAVAAAVLAVIAPWQRLFVVAAPSGVDAGTFFFVDGWGRYPARIADNGAHGARYGILLCLAAALLLAGAACAGFGGRQGRRRTTTAGAALLVAGTAFLAATVGAAALAVVSTSDSYAAQAMADDGTSGPEFRVVTGGMIWLGLAAIVVGLAAVALPLVVRARPAPAPETASAVPLALPVPERPRYVPHADDELLDV